ncbi:MAG: S41 family peptidase [Rhodospirillaceae bacterium]|nr:S41 family peptidase [Rhodospirillaceae bacterium]
MHSVPVTHPIARVPKARRAITIAGASDAANPSAAGRSRLVTLALLAGVVLGLAGCAGSGSSHRAGSLSAQAERETVKAVLRSGFGEIRDKAIVERSPAELFLPGLKRVSLLDSDLRLEVTETHLTLTYLAAEIQQWPRPPADDLQAWVNVTADIYGRAKVVSQLAQITDREAFYQIMFDAALPTIDAYSSYSGWRNARTNRATRNGFIGIGIDFDMVPGGVIIRSLVPDGPAARAGLQIDDLIVSADGQDLVGQTREGARKVLSGPPDSIVKLVVYRANTRDGLDLAMRRALIVPRSVEATDAEGIAYLQVKTFNVRTSSDVAEAIAQLKAARDGQIKGVVLDLRGDPGGLLDQAVDLADLFLEAGTITTLSGRHPGAHQYYAARPGDILAGKPLVILVDGKSASAAEIAAAALADNGRAIVVGTNTLGKGSVQTLIRLPNDGEIALTWSEVVSPGGYRIHGLGLLPTVCTSGFVKPLATMVEHVYRREAPWRAAMEQWRTADRSTPSLTALRELCPAEPRTEAYIDRALGLRLAADQPLYAQASAPSLAAGR